MIHKHHIIPKHVTGGVANNHPDNLWICDDVEEHAELHKQRYLMYGDWQDEAAWKGLAGIIGHEEAVRLVQSNAGKMAFANGNPTMLSKTRFTSGSVAQRNATQMAKRPESVAKRNAAVRGQGAGLNNSQYGTMWITNGFQNKKVQKSDSIIEGWRKGRVMIVNL